MNKTESIFSFELDTFQKEAIEAITQNKHVLVTAHTGSGKTVPAEFAIHYFCTIKHKKVIYTSPIKSLSNQKFHELTKQFPDISVGIMTGDIKFNPDADCIIMTTEILRNVLSLKKHTNMDFDVSQLSCVIFDEIHYINDMSRGKVWEECIMLLPKEVQMIMLSATIQNPVYFASWIQDTKEKEVIITGTNKRVVPLTHYTYLSLPEKYMKHESIQKYTNIINCILPIKTNVYHQKTVDKINNVYKIIYKNNIRIPSSFALNQIIQTLNKENKLPAICFVFSRKRAEQLASMIECNLHNSDNVTDDIKRSVNVYKECESILRTKLSNYKEYIHSSEYTFMLSLLEKGIAVHHSGIIPILREMIELLFSKGYIKLLFATETFSVGINMPTKTVLFTSVTKYDGTQERLLLPHEYTQMAGRAGRRGLDSVGYVIHLHSLFEPPNHADYAHMLSGNAQSIQSKMDIDFGYFLRMLSVGNDNSIIETSLLFRTIQKQKQAIEKEQNQIRETLENTTIYHDSSATQKIHRIDEINALIIYATQKQKKQFEAEKRELENELYAIYTENEVYLYKQYTQSKASLEKEYTYLNNQIQSSFDVIQSILTRSGFLYENELTKKGQIASMIQEVHSLVLAECFHDLDTLNEMELIQFLSVFVQIRIPEQYRMYKHNCDGSLSLLLERLEMRFDYYQEIETKEIGYIQEDIYFYQYDLIEYMKLWCESNNENAIKALLVDMSQYQIFTGEFVKAILKINAIAFELETICDVFHCISLKAKLHSIPDKTLKYIATNQSLYV